MIDLQAETVLTLADAARYVPRRRRGRKVHVSTLYRWAQRGIRGIKLETLRLGGGLVTSVEALQRFAERLTSVDGAPVTRSEPQRRRDTAWAEAELEKLGI